MVYYKINKTLLLLGLILLCISCSPKKIVRNNLLTNQVTYSSTASSLSIDSGYFQVTVNSVIKNDSNVAIYYPKKRSQKLSVIDNQKTLSFKSVSPYTLRNDNVLEIPPIFLGTTDWDSLLTIAPKTKLILKENYQFKINKKVKPPYKFILEDNLFLCNQNAAITSFKNSYAGGYDVTNPMIIRRVFIFEH